MTVTCPGRSGATPDHRRGCAPVAGSTRLPPRLLTLGDGNQCFSRDRSPKTFAICAEFRSTKSATSRSTGRANLFFQLCPHAMKPGRRLRDDRPHRPPRGSPHPQRLQVPAQEPPDRIAALDKTRKYGRIIPSTWLSFHPTNGQVTARPGTVLIPRGSAGPWPSGRKTGRRFS